MSSDSGVSPMKHWPYLQVAFEGSEHMFDLVEMVIVFKRCCGIKGFIAGGDGQEAIVLFFTIVFQIVVPCFLFDEGGIGEHFFCFGDFIFSFCLVFFSSFEAVGADDGAALIGSQAIFDFSVFGALSVVG